MKSWPLYLFYFIILWLLWLILAASASLSETLIGALSSLLVLFWLRASLLTRSEIAPIRGRKLLYVGRFFIVWLKDLVVSNIEVAKIVLSRTMPIAPGFHTMPQPLKSPLNQTILANAITLTPGTLTVDFDDASVLVHSLRLKDFEDLQTARFLRYLKALEEDAS